MTSTNLKQTNNNTLYYNILLPMYLFFTSYFLSSKKLSCEKLYVLYRKKLEFRLYKISNHRYIYIIMYIYIICIDILKIKSII